MDEEQNSNEYREQQDSSEEISEPQSALPSERQNPYIQENTEHQDFSTEEPKESFQNSPEQQEVVPAEEPQHTEPQVQQPLPSQPASNPKYVEHPIQSHELDAELEALLAKQTAKIKVIGCGGAGNNTINRMTEVGIVGAETIAINTDAQDLLYTNATKKILIGRETTQGLGAGSIPKKGEESARESEMEIKKALGEADLVFITCGLGGGTGTGSAPVVADVAKKMGALTVAIVTMPFAMEGNRRYENSIYGLERLEQIVDTLIVIPNDKLIELAPDLPVHTAFKVADEILTNAVKGIAELVTKAGLVNLDFADIQTIMSDGGVALIGVGESDSENRAKEAVEKAISNPLLDVDISGANGALINISGGPDMTLEEAKEIVAAVNEKLDEEARVIWGAQIYEDLEGTIRTMLIVTGVKSSQILGRTLKTTDKKNKEIEDSLGIEFLG